MANLPVLVKPASSLSTTTLISALWNEPNWDAQVEIARQLETRDDVFNLNPLFEFLLDGNQKRMVQRAVARCTAKLGLAQALKQMELRVLDPAVDDAQKLLALRALADMARPDKTLPLLARLSTLRGLSMAARQGAFFRLGQSGSLQALPLLLHRVNSRDPQTAAMARQALATCLELTGGTHGAIQGLLRKSIQLAARGQRGAAGAELAAALRLSVNDQRNKGNVGRQLCQLLAA